MIEFLQQANVVTGIPAVFMGFLMMIAFRGYAFTFKGSAVAHLGAALFWLSFRVTGRSIWWDAFVGFGLGNTSNWVWNLIGFYAFYHAMLGFYLLLPPEERKNYNIITVAFYPRRLWRRLHEENDT